MSKDNGTGRKLLVKVDLVGGKMDVVFGRDIGNIALVSHALRLANLELDNILIGQQQPDETVIEAPTGIDVGKFKR